MATISKLFPTGVLQTTVDIDEVNLPTSASALISESPARYLTVPANDAFTLGTNNHTIEFWMYQTSRGTYDTPFSYFGAATQQETNNYYMNVGTQFNLLLGGGPGTWAINFGIGSPPALNAWHHYAIVRNGTTFTVYVNGTSRGSRVSSQSIGAQGAGGSMIIGAYDNSGATPIKGNITNFRFTNGVALYTSNFTVSTSPLLKTGAETKLLLRHGTNNTLLTDSSGNFFNARNNNSVTWSSSSPFAALPKMRFSPTSVSAIEFDEVNLDSSVAERRKSDGTYQVSGYLDEITLNL
jgi:hypothetical protein